MSDNNKLENSIFDNLTNEQFEDILNKCGLKYEKVEEGKGGLTITDPVNDLNAKLEEAFRLANNAIYFDDDGDYRSALWELCMALKPDINKNEIGGRYIERKKLWI